MIALSYWTDEEEDVPWIVECQYLTDLEREIKIAIVDQGANRLEILYEPD